MFSEGLGKCIKVKAIFNVNVNVDTVFKPKLIVPSAVVEPINKET